MALLICTHTFRTCKHAHYNTKASTIDSEDTSVLGRICAKKIHACLPPNFTVSVVAEYAHAQFPFTCDITHVITYTRPSSRLFYFWIRDRSRGRPGDRGYFSLSGHQKQKQKNNNNNKQQANKQYMVGDTQKLLTLSVFPGSFLTFFRSGGLLPTLPVMGRVGTCKM